MLSIQLKRALREARIGILVMTITYLLSLSCGILMAQAGNTFALRVRDSVVTRAHRVDPASRADDAGQHALAAGIDFARNLGLAAVPDTVGGLIFILPVATGAYRGWIGGIVSVDAHHHSRLARGKSALYYVVTLALQLTGFILAGGGGLHLGWAFMRHEAPLVGPRWFRLPKRALLNVCYLYVIVVPVFALGSLWEFLGPNA